MSCLWGGGVQGRMQWRRESICVVCREAVMRTVIVSRLHRCRAETTASTAAALQVISVDAVTMLSGAPINRSRSLKK